MQNATEDKMLVEGRKTCEGAFKTRGYHFGLGHCRNSSGKSQPRNQDVAASTMRLSCCEQLVLTATPDTGEDTTQPTVHNISSLHH